MKTALKIIGGIVTTLVAAAAIFYFGWLSPPAAADVCDNVERIAREEATAKVGKGKHADAGAEAVRGQCMTRAEKAPEFGRAVWVKRLVCMRDAPDMSGLETCDAIKTL
jgi:hypothetical protein